MEDLDANGKRILEEIAGSCKTCQFLGPKPLRFQATIPEEADRLIFGDELSLDLTFIDGSAIWHVVDTATRFSASTFLDKHGYAYGQSVDGVWAAFLECWATVYSGYPDKIRTDARSIFVLPRWCECTDMAGIFLQISGVESHNSLGLGERMHEPLRRIYRKVSYDPPNSASRHAVEMRYHSAKRYHG
jgi:hypothetical protein